MSGETSIGEVVRQFRLDGEVVAVEPLGVGHINATWCVTTVRAGRTARYTLQRINSSVFPSIPKLMENVRRVTQHLAAKQSGWPDADRRALALICKRDGSLWHEDLEGSHWRLYRFIERTHTLNVVATPEEAHEVARAFGRFQRLLADLPPPPLHETIPGFHDTVKRFLAFEEALEQDARSRVRLAGPEIEFALKRQRDVSSVSQARLPTRITHNDTKVNNVLIDQATGEGLCVIDLDTVMPGLAPNDFGDLVRTAVSPAPEDDPDLSKVECRPEIYRALLRGYLEEARDLLTPEEESYLTVAARMITFETGLRFLTDYLKGDTYFRTTRNHQNLDRCRNQFALVESIERQRHLLEQFVQDHRS